MFTTPSCSASVAVCAAGAVMLGPACTTAVILSLPSHHTSAAASPAGPGKTPALLPSVPGCPGNMTALRNASSVFLLLLWWCLPFARAAAWEATALAAAAKAALAAAICCVSSTCCCACAPATGDSAARNSSTGPLNGLQSNTSVLLACCCHSCRPAAKEDASSGVTVMLIVRFDVAVGCDSPTDTASGRFMRSPEMACCAAVEASDGRGARPASVGWSSTQRGKGGVFFWQRGVE
jgi:hypothetical protein